MQGDPEAMSDAYHEKTSTQHILTKTGEEDEMQVDSERPGTSGTDGSTKLADEDREVLETTRAPPSSFDNEHPPVKGSFLQRPDQELDPTSSFPFTFGQAARSVMDFHGTRKTMTGQTAFYQHPSWPTEQNSHAADGQTRGSDRMQ